MAVAILAANRIQDQQDFGSTPGAGNDGYAITWDNATLRFVLSSVSGGDVSSVFGRTGAVVAVSGDYTAAQVTNAAAVNAANTFTAAQKINVNSTTALFVEQDGVKNNVLIVDITSGLIGFNTVPNGDGDLHYSRSATNTANRALYIQRQNTRSSTTPMTFYGLDVFSDLTNSASGSNNNYAINLASRGFGTQPINLVIGAQFSANYNGSSSAADVIGFNARVGPQSSSASSSITRLYGAKIGPDCYSGNDSYTHTIGTLYGLAFGVNTEFRRTAITTSYAVYVDNLTPSTLASITNQYGLYINSLTSGVTLNYAIYTNAGLNRLGDQLSIVGSADRQQFTATGYTTQTAPVGAFVGNDAVTNTVVNVLAIQKNSTNTPAAGFGAGLKFSLESSTTADQDAARLVALWDVATHASRSAALQILISGSGGEVNAATFDDDATAGNTRMLLYDVDNGQLERVSVGAADSGGAGYKLLRIAN